MTGACARYTPSQTPCLCPHALGVSVLLMDTDAGRLDVSARDKWFSRPRHRPIALLKL